MFSFIISKKIVEIEIIEIISNTISTDKTNQTNEESFWYGK